MIPWYTHIKHIDAKIFSGWLVDSRLGKIRPRPLWYLRRYLGCPASEENSVASGHSPVFRVEILEPSEPAWIWIACKSSICNCQSSWGKVPHINDQLISVVTSRFLPHGWILPLQPDHCCGFLNWVPISRIHDILSKKLGLSWSYLGFIASKFPHKHPWTTVELSRSCRPAAALGHRFGCFGSWISRSLDGNHWIQHDFMT